MPSVFVLIVLLFDPVHVVMHKIILLFAAFGYASSARLDNLQYLPPAGNNIQGPNQQPGFSGVKSGPQPAGQYQSGGPAFGSHSQGASGPQSSPGTEPQQHDSNIFSKQYGIPSAPGASSGPSGQGSQQFPQQKSPLNDVPILRLDTENPGDGTYRYAYETGNDIVAQEEGSAQSGWNKAHGSYRFVSPEGQHFEISYTADENGYVPQGAHLPTPPPIPEAILKSLEVIRQAEASGNIIEGAYQPEGDDGQYHEGHDESQYNHQPSSGGYQPASGGYQQPESGYQQGGVKVTKSGSQAGQLGSGQHTSGGTGFPSKQQPLAPNGGYRY